MGKRFLGIFIFLVIVVAAIGVFVHHHLVENKSTPVALPAKATPNAAVTSYVVPSGWQQYTNPAGFSFWYPSTWGVDDAELTSFTTMHDAFLSYSNLVTAYSSQAAETDPTQGPSVTITMASIPDEEGLLGKTFQSSTAWVNASSTGLPPGAVPSTMTIDGEQAVKVQGLTVAIGDYQVVYFYDKAHNAAIRFDYAYNSPSNIQTLDSIVQSFSFSKSL